MDIDSETIFKGSNISFALIPCWNDEATTRKAHSMHLKIQVEKDTQCRERCQTLVICPKWRKHTAQSAIDDVATLSLWLATRYMHIVGREWMFGYRAPWSSKFWKNKLEASFKVSENCEHFCKFYTHFLFINFCNSISVRNIFFWESSGEEFLHLNILLKVAIMPGEWSSL